MSGIDETGIEIPTLLEIKGDVIDDLRGTVDTAIGDSENGVEANEAATIASTTRDVYEALQLVVNALNPNNAEGSLLENLSTLTGTYKQPARKSSFKGARQVSLSVAAGATIPAGQIFSQLGRPEIRAVTLQDAVNPSGITASVLVDAEAETVGPTIMAAGSMTVKVTNATGWNSITNPQDALIGDYEEKDTALRYRRQNELAGQGSGNIDSIRADLLKLELSDGSNPVLEAFVLENDRDEYDKDTGLPPHSLEPIIWDKGVTPNADLAAAIFTKAGGIRTVGSTVVTHVDTYGYSHEVRFTRVTEKVIKLELTYKRNASLYQGDAAVALAVATATQLGYPNIEGLPFRPGALAEWSALSAVAKAQPGVLNITKVRLAFVANAFAAEFADLQLDFREVATLSSNNVTIIVV